MKGYNMSNQGESLTIRMNKELKAEFVEFCHKKKLTQTNALHYFVKKSLAEKRLPFTTDETYSLGMKSYNGDDVVRVGFWMKDPQVKADFKKLCDGYELTMAGAIKLYLEKCVEEGDFPF